MRKQSKSTSNRVENCLFPIYLISLQIDVFAVGNWSFYFNDLVFASSYTQHLKKKTQSRDEASQNGHLFSCFVDKRQV